MDRPWSAPVAVGAVGVTGCVALGLLNPSEAGPLLCPFRAMTGLDCPGCGMTRALSRLTQGRIGTALDYNIVLVIAVPALCYLYLRWLASAFGLNWPPLRLGRTANAVVLLTLMAFSVLRNLPIGIGRYLNSQPIAG